ncbi:hypothetical protein Gpo141_00000930 [Globisporangium polare]
MASLLLHWLNDELQLHRRVEVLERDLCNGYIFAEVLHSAGLEKQLDKYEDKQEMASRIHNMELLGSSLEKLGIPFPVRLRRSIMMEDRSAALQFLLQLKGFIQKRGKKPASSVKAVSSRVYARSQAKVNESKLPQDVEERFVKETASKLRPKEVEFSKDVNMAVHLRKFEQAQWTAENELVEFQENQKAAKAADSVSGMHAVRTHLNEKRAFMKEWDKEHHDNWKETQRLYMMAERDDLRLELTMQERARIHEERKLNFIQRDADEGVVNFEKSMTRLGLGGVATASSNVSALRAIPVTDAGALAHFKKLEGRVEELEFRPSNNVKMMKELRARRKAQLAAEKDRRMRRRKSNGDQSSAQTSDLGHESSQSLESEDLSASSGPTSDSALDSLRPNPETESSIIRNIREEYLESKRAELEANYDQLREIGAVRREADMQTLHAIRAEGYTKADFHKRGVCADAAEALISFAFDYAILSASGKLVDMDELKRNTFLRVAATDMRQNGAKEDGGDESDTNDVYPRRITMERGMQYASVDLIVDECIQMSVDPQKQADAAASPLSELERDFGALGIKASGLRQKSTALPEALVVEIVSKYIQLMQSVFATQERESEEQSIGNSSTGFVLHNFPRSLEEAKLFERALIANISDEENRTSKLAAFESLLKGESSDSVYVSRVDATVIITAAPVSAEVLADAESRPPSALDGALAAGQESKRVSVVEKKSPEAIAKAEQYQEMLRRLELRAQLEDFWRRTSRFTKIDRTGMQQDVLAELIHLSIDVMIDESLSGSVVKLDCSEVSLPDLLQAAREQRRARMEPLQRMDQSLRTELCSRFKVIREILSEISAISVQTRQALEAQLEDSSVFQGVLDTVSCNLRGKVSSLSNRERFFTELEVILGDQVDEKRQQANAFIEELRANPTPAMIHCVNKLFQMLPSICFVLKEHTMERIQFLQSKLFDQIPFLRDSESGRGEVALPREVPGEAINAAIELCAPEASVTESVVEDVTRILSHIASQFSFRNTDTNGSQPALHETNVVAAEARDLLERITVLCRFTNRLKWKATDVYEKDSTRLQRYIIADLRSKNASVETAMTEMKQIGSAVWPATRVLQAPSSKLATRLPSSHKAHFLSCEQIRALISAFLARERENPSLAQQPVKHEEFTSLLLDTARRYDFPGSWKTSTALVSLVLDVAAASSAVTSGEGSLSSWRKLVFSIVCTQFVDFPRTRDIEQYAEQAMTLASYSSTGDLLSREDFLRLPLWFEAAVCEDRAFLDEMKVIMYQLFSTTIGQDSDDQAPSVALVPMLLHWCLYPPYGADVRSDVGEFLPKYSRGLVRAFRVLAHMRSQQQRHEPHRVEMEIFHKLLELANIPTEGHRPGHDEDHVREIQWRGDSNDATASFLEFCSAFDPRLARQFLFCNPFDALINTSS